MKILRHSFLLALAILSAQPMLADDNYKIAQTIAPFVAGGLLAWRTNRASHEFVQDGNLSYDAIAGVAVPLIATTFYAYNAWGKNKKYGKNEDYFEDMGSNIIRGLSLMGLWWRFCALPPEGNFARTVLQVAMMYTLFEPDRKFRNDCVQRGIGAIVLGYAAVALAPFAKPFAENMGLSRKGVASCAMSLGGLFAWRSLTIGQHEQEVS